MRLEYIGVSSSRRNKLQEGRVQKYLSLWKIEPLAIAKVSGKVPATSTKRSSEDPPLKKMKTTHSTEYAPPSPTNAAESEYAPPSP